MDPHVQYISNRVFRDGTRYINGKYVKDLSALNRPLEKVVIIDDNPDCISLQVRRFRGGGIRFVAVEHV